MSLYLAPTVPSSVPGNTGKGPRGWGTDGQVTNKGAVMSCTHAAAVVGSWSFLPPGNSGKRLRTSILEFSSQGPRRGRICPSTPHGLQSYSAGLLAPQHFPLLANETTVAGYLRKPPGKEIQVLADGSQGPDTEIECEGTGQDTDALATRA